MKIAGYVVTNRGKVRQNNEDSVALLYQAEPSAHTGFVMGIVADGMGGYENGEVASQAAINLIPNLFFRSSLEPPQALRQAFIEASNQILELSKQATGRSGMGTTGAAMVVDREQAHAWCAWVGDSRIYLFRKGSAYRISEDHTAVRDLVRRGLITAEDARNHSERNVLLQALGTKPTVNVDVTDQPLRLEEGDRILLCSDGLHDLLADNEIAELVADGTLLDCGESLMRLALDRGGYDNISLVLMECSGSNDESGPAKITREVVASC